MNLDDKKCQACENFGAALSLEQASEMLAHIPDWNLGEDHKSISRRFAFKGFNKVMLFLNALAWIAQQEGHHPDVCYGYNYATVTFTTHALQGLSENDFICAAKVNKLFG